MLRKLPELVDQEKGLEKWQIALLTSAPIVVGATVYYYYRRSAANPTEDSCDKNMLNTALDYKIKGNKYFKDGDYSNALLYYTKALKHCPVEDKSQAAIFYQNRAASYEMLKQYENVIQECSHAIKLNKKYIKAFQRRAKGRCSYPSDVMTSI